ncbi:MAG: class II aldolase/adducin family protein [Actinomycetota bacterium]|nr:class II aldolase/adducin family protein [Actinomycetota bacterium]
MAKSKSEYRKDIIEVCKRIYDHGWVAANDGNVSIKVSDQVYLCTPTGRSKGYLTADQLVKVDQQGNKLEGELNPSSEIKMHLDVYRNRPDVNSVVHAHPPTATGFACAGVALDQCVIPEVVISLGSIPLTKYGTPSTEEIPNNIREFLPNHNAFLLENHGALSIGGDVYQAYYRMESMELFAKIYLVAKQMGQINVIDEQNVEKMLKLREEWGMDEHYAGCRVDSRMMDGNNAGQDDQDTITMSKDELARMVTKIVVSIVNNNK